MSNSEEKNCNEFLILFFKKCKFYGLIMLPGLLKMFSSADHLSL